MSSSDLQPPPRLHLSGSTSRTLITGLRANDAAAWDRLVTLYAPLVCHWCRQQGLAESEWADLLQEVFQAVAAHMGRFRKDRTGDTFRGWLRTITRNKIADVYRKRSVQPQAMGGTSAYLQISRVPAPSASLSEDELASDVVAERELIQRALRLIREEFEERTWRAFWLTSVENQAATEAASALGMSAGAVRVAKCRVLRRLREELGEA
jgi:RNA polymerase sigma-70 factor (ECF subfamily)